MLNDVKHIFKLDPAKEISDEELEELAESKTDLIVVGGTDNVTEDNVLDLLARVRRYSVPLALEISNTHSVIGGFDHYFIPVVFNTTNMKYHNGLLVEALNEYHEIIDYDEVSILPYIILNEDCKAFKKAECYLPDNETLTSLVTMIDQLYKSEYIYIECSGKLMSVDKLKSISELVNNSHLIYGGGIKTREEFKERKPYAETLVVGNSIYSDFKHALKTTNEVE